MYNNLHWQALRKMCIDRGLDVTGCSGKDSYIKLLEGKDMEVINSPTEAPKLTLNATQSDFKELNISREGLRLDKLRSDLNSLVGRARARTPDGVRVFERRFNDGKYSYHIDTHENTIHFLGGTLGPVCNNLTTKDGLLLRIAQNYLNANTVKGHDLMVEHAN